MGTWCACAVLLAVAVVAGRVVAEPLSDDVLSIALGFAGGAVRASFATAAGFFLSFILAA